VYTYAKISKKHTHTHKNNSFSDDALQSLHSVDKEASSSISTLARTAELAESDSPAKSPPNSGGRFSLAPEHGTDSYAAAQEFGGMLQHLQEEKDDQKRAQKEGYKAYFASKQPAVEKAPVKKAKKEMYDSFGIPEGSGEGFHVTKYKSAAANKKTEKRTEGISSLQANKEIDQYFSKLGACCFCTLNTVLHF
jgi:hypothetical protein